MWLIMKKLSQNQKIQKIKSLQYNRMKNRKISSKIRLMMN